MGFFEFVQEQGKELFNIGDGDEAQKILDYVQENIPDGIKDLGIDFSDGEVTVSGEAESEDVLDQVRNLIGDISGVSAVNDDDVSVPESEEDEEEYYDEDEEDEEEDDEEEEGVEYYTVQAGDTLSAIAEEYYGDASRYMEIFEANRDILNDPNMIQPGQELMIPLDE